jgi:hypothetical protein
MCGNAIYWDIGAITSLVSSIRRRDAVGIEDVPLHGVRRVYCPYYGHYRYIPFDHFLIVQIIGSIFARTAG